MSRRLPILVLILLLISSATSQASVCLNGGGGVSSVGGIATGIVNLGVPTNSVAQTSYSQSLSGFNLDFYSDVFSGFAIAGFQAASNQQYYSIVINQVYFSNGNTQMNFSLSYSNPTNTFQTTWSKITLSWIAVSTAFQTTVANSNGNYVWATTVGLSAPFSGLEGAILSNSVFGVQTATMLADAQCGYLNTGPPKFDITCAGSPNARFITHAYVSGFQFNPSGPFTLAASVLRNNGLNQIEDIDEALQGSDFVTQTVGNNALNGLTGPQFVINPYGGQLQFIQVTIVITIILDITTYPSPNPANFAYSGIYMNYTLYNNAQPVIQTPRTATTVGQNYNFFSIPTAQYQIYGLSSFQISTLPSNVTVVNYQLSLPNTNTVLLQTDDVNYLTGVKVSADLWNGLVSTTSCSTVKTSMVQVIQKQLTAVPPLQTGVQNIFQTSADLTYSYFALVNSVTTPLSSSVQFTNTQYFANFVPGMAYQIQFSLTANSLDVGVLVPIQYSISI
jgi:hypothetical protein